MVKTTACDMIQPQVEEDNQASYPFLRAPGNVTGDEVKRLYVPHTVEDVVELSFRPDMALAWDFGAGDL